MKKSVLLIMCMMFVGTMFATSGQTISTNLDLATVTTQTPQKLSFKERAAVKVLKKALKKETKEKDADISKGVYILLALLGLGWIGIGLLDDFEGSDWIICLVLYMLFWLPGFIYALIKMKNYY